MINTKCNLKKSWINVELEHAHLFPKGKRKEMAKKIACDHVNEMGKGYYPALLKMENKLSKMKGGKK